MTRTFVGLAAGLAVAAAFAASASASTNPFACNISTNKTTCARANSQLAARQYLGNRFEHGQTLWPGALNCRATDRTLLVWRCAAVQPIPNAKGVVVTWKRYGKSWTVRERLY